MEADLEGKTQNLHKKKFLEMATVIGDWTVNGVVDVFASQDTEVKMSD